ncbi:MAG: hypothetical protein ABIN67_02050 [Ferruginibacter sp.]
MQLNKLLVKSERWNKISSNRFLLSLIGCTLFFAFFACILPIRYEENDDIVMLLFASGKYSGTPEPHLIFINYIYGVFLNFLYSRQPGIEWYSVLFAIIHIISLSVISWKIVCNEKIKWVYKLLFLGLFATIEIRCILYFQFTTTAALSSLAGIILMYYRKSFQRTLGVVLFLVACFIRFEAAFLVLLVISPVFLHHIIANNRIRFAKPLTFLMVAIILSVLFEYVDYRSYQVDANWKYYHQYNKLLGQINDNPNAGKIMNNLPAAISSSDYSLLLFFFPDTRVMNLNVVKLLNKELKQVEFKRKLANVYPALRAYTYYFILLFICSGAIFLRCDSKMKKWVLVFTLFAFFAALIYVSLNGSPKYRVFFSALLPVLFVMYISLEDENSSIVNKILPLGLSAFILLISKQNYGLRNLKIYARQTEFVQQTKLLDQYLSNKNNSVIPFANDLTMQLYSPFSVSKSFDAKKIYFSGWVTNIPLNKTRLESHLDLINRHAIFFSKMNYSNVLPVIKENILVNYGIATKPKIELESKNYVIVKLVAEN